MNHIDNKRLRRNFIYSILGIIIFGLSLILSYGNIPDFNWENVFKSVDIYDNSGKFYDNEMSVHFLDVGKADCCYIKCKDKNILIDAADKESTETITEYLKRRHVEKLDLVVVSHPHRDHIGQMDKVIEEFTIDKFIESKIPDNIIPTSATYEKMLKALNQRNIKTQIVKPGNKLEVGDMKIEILGPIYSHENINNNSLVMKLSYGDISFLFMGDAEKFEEEDIIEKGYNLNSTVLKIGHHGSNTSSTYDFLKKTNPKYAVISVGPDRNNLPKEKVLKRINRFCDKIYRTDENGTIVFLTNGKDIKVTTEK